MKHLAIALVLAAPTVAAAQEVSNLTVTISGLQATLSWTGEVYNPNIFYQYERYSPGFLDQPIVVIADANPMSVAPEGAGFTHYTAGAHLVDWDTIYYFAVYTQPDNILYKVQGRTGPEPDHVSPAMTALAASCSSGSVFLSWTAPGDDGTTGRATRYDIRYSTAGELTDLTWDDPSTVIVTGTPVPAPAGSAETFELQGLAPGTTYYFGLVTADEVANLSPVSNSPAVLLIADMVAPAAMTLRVDAVQAESVTLVWTAPGDDDLQGRAAAYDLRYSTAGAIRSDADFATATPAIDRPLPGPVGTWQGTTVRGLTPLTEVHFAIRAVDESGNRGALATASARTLFAAGSSGTTVACSAGATAWTGVLVLAAAIFLVRR